MRHCNTFLLAHPLLLAPRCVAEVVAALPDTKRMRQAAWGRALQAA
jgi:hypothetical protein